MSKKKNLSVVIFIIFILIAVIFARVILKYQNGKNTNITNNATSTNKIVDNQAITEATSSPSMASTTTVASTEFTNTPLDYKNYTYGFEIKFPNSWMRYQTMMEFWDGVSVNDGSVKYKGPKIVFRNPNWTETKPWQDIPVMIFTKEQWKLAESEDMAVSAAPIGPSKLGENKNYVFALPPRWVGFTDTLGQDEAQNITKSFVAF